MFELTNERRRAIQEGGAKTELSDGGGIKCGSKLTCFLSTKTCKPILVVTQNKNTSLNISITCLLVAFQSFYLQLRETNRSH